MDFQVVRSLPTEAWRSFVESHSKGNIFLSPEMFEVFRLTKGYVPELWATTDQDRILALITPVHITLRGGMLHRLTTRSVAFGGVLCADSPDGHLALRRLLGAYKDRSGQPSLFTEIRNVHCPKAIQSILVEAGFAYEDHLNYLIPLGNGSETVFQRIGARTRKQIRRSLKRNDVRIVEVTERAQVALCYELLCQAYRNARVPLADPSLFYAAFDLLRPKGMVRFTLGFVNDEPAATSIDLLYKDLIFGWYGGTDRRFVAQVPTEAVMWNVLDWGCQNQFHVYDFGGAGKPNEKYGVRDFKAKFGGELVCYGRNTWVANPALMKVSRRAYEAFRYFAFQDRPTEARPYERDYSE